MMRLAAVVCLLLCLLHPCAAQQPGASPSPTPTPRPKLGWDYELGGQVTVLWQHLWPFHSPYVGTNSFLSSNEAQTSQTYTLFFGVRPLPQLEVYVNPEMARGLGLSNALGLAGYTNGEVIRNPTISMSPYIARLFARYTIPTGKGVEEIAEGENQIEGKRPTHRLVFTLGKIGTNDIFDTNRYANSTRTQFMNWALINNAAYDYAADTRGYTRGLAVEWIQPEWALRAGTFQMPLVANGSALGAISHNHGDQIELEVHPRLLSQPAVVRLLAYRNVADMGLYREAVALGIQSGTTPDITATRKPGREKFGMIANFEQPLADDGETGLFGRFGWASDDVESFAYTECERHLSIGAQLSGRHWGRPDDHVGVAFVVDGLSVPHRQYLANGGLGFLLGDGRLNYGTENVLETYYSFQATKFMALSVDFQHLQNPGYNRDRGPVNVLSGRLHFEF